VAGDDDPLANWHRLHAASPVVNLIPQAWQLLRAYWPLLLALFIGSEVGLAWMDLAILPIFFLAPMVRTLVHWATLRYRVRDGRLEIRSGLINRQVRLIGPERIQNSELVRNPLHRVAGLVEVRLETAGGQQTEGLLSALTRDDAQRLMARLEALRRAAASVREPEEEAAEPGQALLRQSLAELVGFGLSSRRVGVIAVGAAVLLELWQQLGHADGEVLQQGLHPGFLAGVLLAGIVVGILLALANAILRHYDFLLFKQQDRLVIEQGLLTRRRVELPRKRIQLLRIDEPLLRRLMGFATLQVETAGMAAGPDGMRQAEASIPMVERSRIHEICGMLLDHLDVDPWGGDLLPAPARAMWWGQQRALRNTLLVLVLALVLGGTWGALGLLTWPLFAVSAWLDWRWQAWRVTENLVVARRGFWLRRTWILPRAKVQAAHRLQGPLMRIWGLSLVLVKMAGNRVWLPPLRWDDAGTCLRLAAAGRALAGRERDIFRQAPQLEDGAAATPERTDLTGADG